jgi:putative ABC transport system substrate-binding protein
VTSGGYDLVVTSSTPSMQALANNNRDGHVKHLFTLVADPFASGVGLDRANPLAHPPHMAGQSSFPPVERAFQIARQMLPGLQRVGVAWNPAESNSLIFVTKAREIAKAMGFALLEANVDNTSGVGEAINSLASREAQAIWVGGDNTVIAAINTVIDAAKRQHIPVFTILPGKPDRGTLFDAGPDFYGVGLGGDLAPTCWTARPRRFRCATSSTGAAVLSIGTTVLRGFATPGRCPASSPRPTLSRRRRHTQEGLAARHPR